MYEVLIENELKFVFDKYRNVPNIEIEARLGWYEIDKFNTDIGKHFYDMIYETLNAFDEKRIKKIRSNTDVYTHNKNRIIYDTDKSKISSSHQKISLYTSDILLIGSPFDLRISVSIEKPLIPGFQTLDLKIWTKVRARDRTRFEYKMWNYELTKVKSIIPNCKYSESCNSFEFEIEFDISKCKSDISNLYLSKSLLMKIIDIVRINKNETINISDTILKTYKVKKKRNILNHMFLT